MVAPVFARLGSLGWSAGPKMGIKDDIAQVLGLLQSPGVRVEPDFQEWLDKNQDLYEQTHEDIFKSGFNSEFPIDYVQIRTEVLKTLYPLYLKSLEQ